MATIPARHHVLLDLACPHALCVAWEFATVCRTKLLMASCSFNSTTTPSR